MQAEVQESPVPPPRRKRGILFWTSRIVLFLILFVLSIFAAVHLAPVQQWGIHKITRSIEKTLSTRASVRGFTLNPISDLTLKEVYIGSPGKPEDTLIYAENLTVDYKR